MLLGYDNAMLDHLIQLLLNVGTLITRYPAILDGIRLAVAGLFFRWCRQALDSLAAAIMKGESSSGQIVASAWAYPVD